MNIRSLTFATIAILISLPSALPNDQLERSYIDYSTEAPLTEKLFTAPGKGVFSEERIRTTTLGKVIIRRETERYAKGQILKEREILSSAKQDGELNQRTLMVFSNENVEISRYELVSGTWKRILFEKK